MAERYEVIIDFSKVGQRVILKNLGLPNNVEYGSVKDIMAFDVVGPATSQVGNAEPPPVLNPNMDVMGVPGGPTTPGRTFELVRKNGMWTVNGQTWVDVIDADYGAPLASPAPGATEVWEIKNTSSGWFHPFHIHLVDFRILDRNGKPPFRTSWARRTRSTWARARRCGSRSTCAGPTARRTTTRSAATRSTGSAPAAT
jgi:FtsP/CotA-like multicopper oxidase with cupredoxin domain